MQNNSQKERPILFSTPMVRALIEGRKTQTRRIVKPQPVPGPIPGMLACYEGDWAWRRSELSFTISNKPNGPDDIADDCPFGVPGDRLWVREAWQVFEHEDVSISELRKRYREGQLAGDLVYKADDPNEAVDRWRSSLHMPREFSRITLTITDVRVERLQDISEADAVSEGAPGPMPHYSFGDISEIGPITHRDGFRDLWDTINGPGAWDANPWVWALTVAREMRK